MRRLGGWPAGRRSAQVAEALCPLRIGDVEAGGRAAIVGPNSPRLGAVKARGAAGWASRARHSRASSVRGARLAGRVEFGARCAAGWASRARHSRASGEADSRGAAPHLAPPSPAYTCHSPGDGPNRSTRFRRLACGLGGGGRGGRGDLGGGGVGWYRRTRFLLWACRTADAGSWAVLRGDCLAKRGAARTQPEMCRLGGWLRREAARRWPRWWDTGVRIVAGGGGG